MLPTKFQYIWLGGFRGKVNDWQTMDTKWLQSSWIMYGPLIIHEDLLNLKGVVAFLIVR